MVKSPPSNAGVWVQSLVMELKSHLPWGTAEKFLFKVHPRCSVCQCFLPFFFFCLFFFFLLSSFLRVNCLSVAWMDHLLYISSSLDGQRVVSMSWLLGTMLLLM